MNAHLSLLQQSISDARRVKYLQKIIEQSPTTPKARNAAWLIGEIENQIAYDEGADITDGATDDEK